VENCTGTSAAAPPSEGSTKFVDRNSHMIVDASAARERYFAIHHIGVRPATNAVQHQSPVVAVFATVGGSSFMSATIELANSHEGNFRRGFRIFV
jgi:GTP cyclohydrolase III